MDKDGVELGENYDFDIDNSDYLSVFQFAKSDENGQSIEFVHKTVYEYFAAVKLFEDYFKKLTIQTSIEDAWKLIIKAFGQCDFEFDIIKHLAELMKGLDLDVINHFYTTFANGMLKNELLIQFINAHDDIDEHDNIGIALIPIKMIFGCLIMMLSFMGYKNSQYSRLADKGWGSANQKTFDFFFRNLLPVCLDSYYDFSEWNFEDADLSGMDIRHISFNKAILNKANLNATTINNFDLEDEKIGFNNAHMIGCKMKGINYKFVTFENANLEGSSLNGSYVYDSSFVNAILFKADLSGSRINCSSFKGADLKEASLRGVILDGVDFENADLRGADLRGVFFLNLQDKTRFNGAKYNNDRKSNSNITFFPDGFDPKERGMILDNTSY